MKSLSDAELGNLNYLRSLLRRLFLYFGVDCKEIFGDLNVDK